LQDSAIQYGYRAKRGFTRLCRLATGSQFAGGHSALGHGVLRNPWCVGLRIDRRDRARVVNGGYAGAEAPSTG